ncbi:hypothetical protein [Kitasatospora sp. NPDC057541]|uniref:hypothetical protein n=1 Tax=unclassified Kitasatospora TaxID=2633591 RepID=UPI0036A675D1
MDELTFRSKDRYHWSWSFAIWFGMAAAIAGARVVYDLGTTTLLWMTGGIAVLSVPRLVARDSWSTVGPAGITIHGPVRRRGRTYPWQDVRWMEVYETESRFGPCRMLQIHFANGRSRFLTGLVQDHSHPSPDFDEQVWRVRNWWHLSTEPAARVRPPKKFLDLPTSQLVALVAIVVIGTVVPVIVIHKW